jgi:hypothetical protein
LYFMYDESKPCDNFKASASLSCTVSTILYIYSQHF